MKGTEFCRETVGEESSREFLVNDEGELCVIHDDDDDDGSLFSININVHRDRVYVCVGKSKCSMDALLWTLNHAITPPTLLYLIHVFPVVRLVPSPLGGGMLPRSQANPKVVDTYLGKQRDKRNKLLQTYIDACSHVKVQTVVVESDSVSKAILELIPSLHIQRLVLGSTKLIINSNQRGTVTQILRNAPQTCEINIICNGKQVNDRPSRSAAPSPRDSSASSDQERLPEMRRSRSESAVRSLPFWNPFKWVLIKPSRRPHQLPISSFYHNLLK